MNDDEQRILITQATPGMVLSQSVRSQGGVVLCGPGSALTEALIQRLTMRGVKRIFVQGRPLPSRSQAPLDQRIGDLRRRFSKVGHVPLMAIVERAIEAEVVKRA